MTLPNPPSVAYTDVIVSNVALYSTVPANETCVEKAIAAAAVN